MTHRPSRRRASQQDRADLWQRMNETLNVAFEAAERCLIEGSFPPVPAVIVQGCDAMFASATQAFREVALGCLLTKLHDPTKNIRLPYVRQGSDAFNGRTLDERIVNPFLRNHSIPCSTGPYLNVFRRQASFYIAQGAGLKDPQGFSGLLQVIQTAEEQPDPSSLTHVVEYVVYRFVQLREQSRVDLFRLERMSLTQYEKVVKGLISRQSGGFFPVALVVATVRAIKETFGLDWVIQHQGINVADAASAVGGDITIRVNDSVIMVIEVTERPVEMERLQRTFTDKIAGSTSDYVFMVHLRTLDPEVKEQADRYFAQGHEVNFVDITEWIRNALVSTGSRGRRTFQAEVISLLGGPEVPKTFKVAWNEEVQRAI